MIVAVTLIILFCLIVIPLLQADDADRGIYIDRYPNELSGGQQQRVAIARVEIPPEKINIYDAKSTRLIKRAH